MAVFAAADDPRRSDGTKTAPFPASITRRQAGHDHRRHVGWHLVHCPRLREGVLPGADLGQRRPGDRPRLLDRATLRAERGARLIRPADPGAGAGHPGQPGRHRTGTRERHHRRADHRTGRSTQPPAYPPSPSTSPPCRRPIRVHQRLAIGQHPAEHLDPQLHRRPNHPQHGRAPRRTRRQDQTATTDHPAPCNSSPMSPATSSAAHPPQPGSLAPLTPARVLDTRTNQGASGPVPANGVIDVQITGQGGVPATGVSAVAVNVTAVSPTDTGFISAWPSGSAAAEHLDPQLHRRPNHPQHGGAPRRTRRQDQTATTDHPEPSNSSPTSPATSSAEHQPHAGSLASADPGPGAGHPDQPGRDRAGTRERRHRRADHRTRRSTRHRRIRRRRQRHRRVADRHGFISAWPSGSPQPNTSILNFTAGQTTPNMVVLPVGPDGKIKLLNGSPGTVQLLADVTGYFIGPNSPR